MAGREVVLPDVMSANGVIHGMAVLADRIQYNPVLKLERDMF